MRIELHPEHESMVLIGRSVRGDGPLPPTAPGSPVPDPAMVVDTLVAVVKVTFTADDPTATPASDQRPLERVDVAFPDTGDDPELRNEHDLAVVKPRADVVVLGPPREPVNAPEGGTLREPWTEAVTVGDQRMEAHFPDPGWGGTVPRATFGWQNRTEHPRRGYAGSFGEDPDDPAFDPAGGLPVGFDNRFFSGGRYTAAGEPVFAHLPPGATVSVSTTGTYDMGDGTDEDSLLEPPDLARLHLPAAFPSAVVAYRDSHGAPDQADVAMVADTLVFHRDEGWFAVTWRGVWDLATVPRERYLRVALTGGP